MKIFGSHEPNVIQQLQNCVDVEEGALGVLCADGHLGYAQPIGGAVAYREHVSVSGVGYDIGCIAAGARVLTADGYHVAIEDLDKRDRPVRPDGQGHLGVVTPYLGIAARGERPVLNLRLADGRSLRLTGDHEIRTRRGWKRTDRITVTDGVLVPIFTGLPYEGDVANPADLATLMRIAGYVNGDGHIVGKGRAAGRVFGITTSKIDDVPSLVEDVVFLTGYRPPVYTRVRPNGSFEAAIRINHRGLTERLLELGCPAGRKRDSWSDTLTGRLLELPPWARAQYLAAFAAAEGTTPGYHQGLCSLQINQVGRVAIEHVLAVGTSLGFRWGTTDRGSGAFGIQLKGGEEEQLRFLAEVGYRHTREKSRASARAASVLLQARLLRARRNAVAPRVRQVMATGATVREAVQAVSSETGFSVGTCHHLLYRGAPARVPRRWTSESDSLGECYWVSVSDVSFAGRAITYDVATADPEAAFLANGITVHNCGNEAVLTNLVYEDVTAEMPAIMDEVFGKISFGMGRKNDEPVDHEVLDHIRDASFAPQRELLDLAAGQLGTVGAGNHYVDIFRDERNRIWAGVHFGSRGFGHKTASGFLALARGKRFDERAPEGEMMSSPVVFRTDSDLGQAYIEAMTLAGEYAYAGRDVVIAKVLEIIGAEAVETIHNHHNFAWKEVHGGEEFWVVRKGCTPAFPGQKGFVGATMGEDAVILEGTELSEEGLASTVHGAGRAMSRTQAAGRQQTMAVCSDRNCDYMVTWKQYRAATAGMRPDEIRFCPEHPGNRVLKRRVRTRAGAIDWESAKVDLNVKGIQLRGGAADEAPGAYKRLDEVLAAHGDTIRVLHRLTPIGVAMAGGDQYDPYKD